MFGLKSFPRFFLLVGFILLAAGCSVAPAFSSQPAGNPVINAAATDAPRPAGQAARTGNGPGITVTGTGKASGTPDMVQVSMGVETQDQIVQKAVNDNQTQMNALLAKLKDLGIPEKDIQTSSYNIFSQHPSLSTGPDGKGDTGSILYSVSNQVQTTIRDVSKLGNVLDQVVMDGANNIYGVTFGFSDPSKLETDARTKAVQDAGNRAQSLAKLEGVTLGTIISVNEVNSFPGPTFPAASSLGGGGTPIQPGALEVIVSIQVTYTIK